MVNYYYFDNDGDDESESTAKIGLESVYNDFLVNGLLILEQSTADDGDDNEEIVTGDMLVAYPLPIS